MLTSTITKSNSLVQSAKHFKSNLLEPTEISMPLKQLKQYLIC